MKNVYAFFFYQRKLSKLQLLKDQCIADFLTTLRCEYTDVSGKKKVYSKLNVMKLKQRARTR